jgi:hypothetical protein
MLISLFLQLFNNAESPANPHESTNEKWLDTGLEEIAVIAQLV